MLLVCTANVCRSPVAERLLARHLARVGVPAVVTSAGTHGGRLRVHRDTIEAARLGGIDLTDHTSRAVTRDLIATDGADLIVGMTREHVTMVVGLDPSAWPRTFTLRRLIRRATALADDGVTGTWDTWLEAIGVDRRPTDVLNGDARDDVPDPYGRPLSAHIAMTASLDEDCARLARVFPGARR